MASEQFDAVLADLDKAFGMVACNGSIAGAICTEAKRRLAAAHAAEVGERDALLGQCYVIAGADTDGNPPERMAKYAVQAVTDLRRDYDEACEELHGPNGWKPRAEAAERDARGLRDTLREARRWIGDGDMGDGLHRSIWTPAYAAIVDRVDACIGGGEGK